MEQIRRDFFTPEWLRKGSGGTSEHTFDCGLRPDRGNPDRHRDRDRACDTEI